MSTKRSTIAQNTGYNLAGSALPLLLSLVTIPLYIRVIGSERYGVLTLAWLLLGYLGLFDLGLGRATAFQIAALKQASGEERASTFWTAIYVNSAIGVVGAGIMWAIATYYFEHGISVDSHLRPELINSVPFLAMSVPVATLIGVLSGALQGREQFLRTNAISVASTALFQILPLGVAWQFGPYLPWLLMAALVARFVAIAVLAGWCYVEIARGFHRGIDRNRVRELLGFGGWISLTSFLGALLVLTDRFLIGAVLGAAAVTLYSVPFQLTQRVAILPSALTAALFPRLSGAHANEERDIADLSFRALASLLTLPVLVGVLLVGPFLQLWVGAKIGTAAAPLGRLLLIGFWLNAFALLPFTRLQASGRPDLVVKVLLAQVVPYIIGLIVAMKYYGLLGCAVMFVVRCLIDLLLLSLTLERRVSGLKSLSINCGLLVAAAILPNFFRPATVLWLLCALLLVAITAAVSFKSIPPQIRSSLMAKFAT